MFNFGGLTFTGRLKMAVAMLWAAALIVATLWFGVPAGWNAIPEKTRKPIEKPFKKMLVSAQPTLDKAKTPLKVMGGLVFFLAPAVTGGTAWFLLNTKKWQAAGNEALAKTGTVYWLAAPMNDKTKWRDAADMWLRLRPALLRPDTAILRGRGVHASLEVVAIEGDGVYWLLWSPDPRALPGKRQDNQDLAGTLGAALAGYNPKIRVTKQSADPLLEALGGEQVQVMWLEVGLAGASQYPIKTDFQGDPMMTLVSSMQTNQSVQAVGMQVLVRPVGDWKAPGQQELNKMIVAQAETGTKTMTKAQKEQRLILESKLDQFGYETVIRFYAAGSDPQALSYRLRAIQDALGQYQGLNSLVVTARGQDAATVISRVFPPRLDPRGVLNAGELSGVYHLPSETWEPVPGIKWAPSRVIPPSAGVIRDWGMPAHLKKQGEN